MNRYQVRISLSDVFIIKRRIFRRVEFAGTFWNMWSYYFIGTEVDEDGKIDHYRCPDGQCDAAYADALFAADASTDYR
jgi:hypothetical protein